jgi:hypothetical protein
LFAGSQGGDGDLPLPVGHGLLDVADAEFGGGLLRDDCIEHRQLVLELRRLGVDDVSRFAQFRLGHLGAGRNGRTDDQGHDEEDATAHSVSGRLRGRRLPDLLQPPPLGLNQHETATTG